MKTAPNNKALIL